MIGERNDDIALDGFGVRASMQHRQNGQSAILRRDKQVVVGVCGHHASDTTPSSRVVLLRVCLRVLDNRQVERTDAAQSVVLASGGEEHWGFAPSHADLL